MTKTFSQIKKINFQKEIIRLLETKKLVSWIQVNSPTNKKRRLAMRMIATCLCMMLSLSTNLYADNITPAEALNIARRYVTIDKKTNVRFLHEALQPSPQVYHINKQVHLIIYITTPRAKDS